MSNSTSPHSRTCDNDSGSLLSDTPVLCQRLLDCSFRFSQFASLGMEPLYYESSEMKTNRPQYPHPTIPRERLVPHEWGAGCGKRLSDFQTHLLGMCFSSWKSFSSELLQQNLGNPVFLADPDISGPLCWSGVGERKWVVAQMLNIVCSYQDLVNFLEKKTQKVYMYCMPLE